MGNTASAITCYPLKAGVRQGSLAGEGVMVISYFLQGEKLQCLVSASSKDLSPECFFVQVRNQRDQMLTHSFPTTTTTTPTIIVWESVISTFSASFHHFTTCLYHRS